MVEWVGGSTLGAPETTNMSVMYPAFFIPISKVIEGQGKSISGQAVLFFYYFPGEDSAGYFGEQVADFSELKMTTCDNCNGMSSVLFGEDQTSLSARSHPLES